MRNLAKRTVASSLTLATDVMTGAIRDLATVLSGTLTEAQMGQALVTVRKTSEALKKLEEVAKERIVTWLKANGNETETGGRELKVGSLTFKMHRSRTGTNPKKFEALLRAKGFDPENYMTKTVTLSMSELGLENALKKGRLTEDELATCEYEESWTLKTPTEE